MKQVITFLFLPLCFACNNQNHTANVESDAQAKDTFLRIEEQNPIFMYSIVLVEETTTEIISVYNPRLEYNEEIENTKIDTVKYLSKIKSYDPFNEDIKYEAIDKFENLIRANLTRAELYSHGLPKYSYAFKILKADCAITNSYKYAYNCFHAEKGKIKQVQNEE